MGLRSSDYRWPEQRHILHPGFPTSPRLGRPAAWHPRKSTRSLWRKKISFFAVTTVQSPSRPFAQARPSGGEDRSSTFRWQALLQSRNRNRLTPSAIDLAQAAHFSIAVRYPQIATSLRSDQRSSLASAVCWLFRAGRAVRRVLAADVYAPTRCAGFALRVARWRLPRDQRHRPQTRWRRVGFRCSEAHSGFPESAQTWHAPHSTSDAKHR